MMVLGRTVIVRVPLLDSILNTKTAGTAGPWIVGASECDSTAV